MIRDSLRRRVSALEHDRQEREKFTGAATEQTHALAGRYIEKAQRALDDGRPVKCECGGDFDLTITVAP